LVKNMVLFAPLRKTKGLERSSSKKRVCPTSGGGTEGKVQRESRQKSRRDTESDGNSHVEEKITGDGIRRRGSNTDTQIGEKDHARCGQHAVRWIQLKQNKDRVIYYY